MSSLAWTYLLCAVVFFAVILLVPPMIKKWYYKSIMEDLEKGDISQYEKKIDSFLAKITFSAFERECMRLTLYQVTGQNTKADEQVQFIRHMRLSKKQKCQLGERAFYVYLEQGKIKKARAMLEMVKEFGTEPQAMNLEIQYSVLLKKESKYIDELKRRHDALKGSAAEIPASLLGHAGTYEYLIGLQYSYLKDAKNTRKWMEMALKNLKGTPYEEDILKILEAN